MVQIALAQPKTAFGPSAAEQNMGTAGRLVWEAADRGADLICFPETFPGLWRAPIDWTPVDELRELAAAASIHIVAGYAEPLPGSTTAAYNSLSLFGPSGEEIGRYRRTVPKLTPWIYRDGPLWGFDWVAADELPVFRTSFGSIGLAICSEMFASEVARTLAVNGAELLLLPAGTMGPSNPLFGTWRTLGWARAIENLACTAMCSNVIDSAGGDGMAMVAMPEDIVFESHSAGLFVVEINLERVRWLREQEDCLIVGPAQWRTKPGLLRDWRSPALDDAVPGLPTGARPTGRR